MIERKLIPLGLLDLNEGQVPGLPSNPRRWTKAEIRRMVKSLIDLPEMLEARDLLVYPFKGRYVVLGGNLRLYALRELGSAQAPVAIVPETTTPAKLREILVKDNGAFGEWDYDALANEWNDCPLIEWGVPAWEDEGEQTQDQEETRQQEGTTLSFNLSTDEYNAVLSALQVFSERKEDALLMALGITA